MYYRNANCAVVVYDITQAVWPHLGSCARRERVVLIITTELVR